MNIASLNNREKKVVNSYPSISIKKPRKNFIKYLRKTLQDINTDSGTINLTDTNVILDEFGLTCILKDTKGKYNLILVFHNPLTKEEPENYLTVKSFLGSLPTLFNASKASNILYVIEPELKKNQIDLLNNLETYSERLNWLKDNNFKLIFHSIVNDVFESNLKLIDSRLDEIIAEIVKIKFLNNINGVGDLLKILYKNNPCKYNLKKNPNFYEYKIKRFLVDSSLGLTAKSIWSGTFDVTGGFIIVKKTGELVCFHIYNWNEYQDYLINNTKIDAPDSKESRCDYGRIVFDEKDILNNKIKAFIKLNLQIRFK